MLAIDATIGASARHVGTVAGNYFAVGGFAQYSEQDIELRASNTITDNPFNAIVRALPSSSFDLETSGIWRIGIGATWYFNSGLSVMGAYGLNSVRTQQDHNFTLAGQWFINE